MKIKSFTQTLSQAQMDHGDHPDAKMIKLKAGSLSLFFQKGSLRYISDSENEIVRMIYSAVRDREWLNVEPVISGEKIESGSDSFSIDYDCRYRSDEIDFYAHYTIEGKSDSSVIFRMDGEALETFEKSRIGFCILHPLQSCAGKPCLITHSDGNSETISFPVFISPDQIFTDIKSMKWNAHGSDCTLDFSGDLFETEDQRNWTDASYKTYCTPLSLPCPATVKKGEKITQRVEFRRPGRVTREVPDNRELNLTINPQILFDMPRIGTGRSTRLTPLTKNETEILKNLNFDHYRTDLYLFTPDWTEHADKAALEAKALNYSLELALFFDEHMHSQLEDFIGWLRKRTPLISVISLFHKTEAATTDLLLNTAGPGLKKILQNVRIAYGTNANFAQLNRKVPKSPYADLLCYSVHPQEHASDNITMVENLEGQGCTVESAKQFAGDMEIWVSPVNLQRRFNANIENYETPAPGETFPPQADSRIMSLFGAGWLTGSFKFLAEAGVSGITFFETAGERGIMQGDYDPRWPNDFRSVKGMFFPVYHVLYYLLRNKGLKIAQGRTSHPLKADCLFLTDGTNVKCLVVNLTMFKQTAIIKGLKKITRVKTLNQNTYADSASDFSWIDSGWQEGLTSKSPFITEPYSINFIEGLL
jgi:hypothetical protein